VGTGQSKQWPDPAVKIIAFPRPISDEKSLTETTHSYGVPAMSIEDRRPCSRIVSVKGQSHETEKARCLSSEFSFTGFLLLVLQYLLD